MRRGKQKPDIDRGKRYGTRQKVRYDDVEEAPKRESMKGMWRDRKEKGGWWSPLDRYLQSNIGRKWNDVWSDICRKFNSGSGIGLRVRDWTGWHVDEYDMRNIYGGWSTGLFIDDYGYLRLYPKRNHKPWKKKFKPELNVEFYQQYRGIWYRAVLEELSCQYFDVYDFSIRTYTRQAIRRIKQLNKAELADCGFVNKRS